MPKKKVAVKKTSRAKKVVVKVEKPPVVVKKPPTFPPPPVSRVTPAPKAFPNIVIEGVTITAICPEGHTKTLFKCEGIDTHKNKLTLHVSRSLFPK